MQSFNMQNSNYDDVRRMGQTMDDVALQNLLDESDKKFLEYLIKMHGVISKDQIDLSKFRDVVEGLESLKKTQEHEYYSTLVRPEKTRGSKIPSQMPIPSSSFQLKQAVYITTNTSGNASLIINPYYLGSNASANLSSIYLNNAATLAGNATDANFLPITASQAIPPVYNLYRLVSASVVAKYVGRLDIVQGLIGGAIIFDQGITATATTSAVANTALSKYGDFNLAQDAFFQQENYVLQGLRELYFPLDNTFEQYQTLGTAKLGFGMLLYVLGAPPSTSCFKVDLYFNIECLPDVSFLNYIPTSLCTTPVWGKEEAIREVQKAPITREDEYTQSNQKKTSFWDGLIGKLGAVLPGVAAIAGTIFPQIKPYTGAVGNMLSINQ